MKTNQAILTLTVLIGVLIIAISATADDPSFYLPGNASPIAPTSPLPVAQIDEFRAERNYANANETPIADKTPRAIVTGRPTYHHYIDSITVSNSHATVGTDVDIYCGSTFFDFCPAKEVYGGCVKTYKRARPCGVGEAINAIAKTAGASVRVGVIGYDSISPTNTPTPTPTVTPTATPA